MLLNPEDIGSNTIARMEHCLQNRFNLHAVLGAELEFYIFQDDEPLAEPQAIAFLAILLHRCKEQNIPVIGLDKESGQGQYEAVLGITSAVETVQNLSALKQIIKEAAKAMQFTCDFSAMPLDDHPGSALHFHISLLNDEGKNIFAKPREQQEENQITLDIIGGILALVPETILLCAPSEASYKRYRSAGKTQHAPSHIAWGGNNRTGIIRIPTSTLQPEARRLEFRLPGADAEPAQAMAAFLGGVIYGLEIKPAAPPKLYGNAFDPQYGLPPLPLDLSIAQTQWEQAKNFQQVLTLAEV